MSRERKLLKECALQLGNENMTYWNAGLVKEIEDFLSTPEPTQNEGPIGYAVKMFPRGLHFIGFTVDDEIQEEIEEYGKESIVPLYLHPAPRPEFVRLSDKEIMDIYMKWINDNNGQPLGRVIEDALEEKNK